MNCDNLKKDYVIVDKINCFKHNFTNNTDVDRKELRDKIIDLFKAERAGKGKGALATRVIYCVEDINGEIIYLKRPAPLNKGFDFEVHTRSKLFFGRIKSRPSHQCIKNILLDLKSQDIQKFNSVQNIINELYHCNENNLTSINFRVNNISIELLLKCIKWLFIEQDITYWSYSGREMLFKSLKDI